MYILYKFVWNMCVHVERNKNHIAPNIFHAFRIEDFFHEFEFLDNGLAIKWQHRSMWSEKETSVETNKTLFIFNGIVEACVKSTQPLLDNDKTDILKYSMKRAKSRENAKFSAKKFLTWFVFFFMCRKIIKNKETTRVIVWWWRNP